MLLLYNCFVIVSSHFVIYCSTHLQDLKDVTEEYHYENYRANYIQSSENNNIPSKSATKGTGSTSQGGRVEQLLSEKDEEV